MSSILLYKWAALASPMLSRTPWAIEAAAIKTSGRIYAPGPIGTQYEHNHAEIKAASS